MERLQTKPLASAFWAAPRPSQQERYEKVLRATIDIAREGGYDAVQIRTVAKRSGVAMGTVYTYFQSRDNLLYRAMVAWNARVAEQVAEDAGPKGFDDLEMSVVALMNRYRVEPGLLDAYIRSTLSTDPFVVAQRRNVDWAWWSEFHPTLARLGPETAEIAPRLLTDVFYSSAVRWAFGQIELADIATQLRNVVRLMLRAAPARS
jgi:AcrR family transcriptional regulator